MAFLFQKTRDGLKDDLEDQVDQLTREVRVLKKTLSKQGARSYSDARDGAAELYEDLWERFAEALPTMRRKARVATKTAQDNAVPIIVGVAVVGLLAALLARR